MVLGSASALLRSKGANASNVLMFSQQGSRQPIEWIQEIFKVRRRDEKLKKICSFPTHFPPWLSPGNLVMAIVAVAFKKTSMGNKTFEVISGSSNPCPKTQGMVDLFMGNILGWR